jgi:hypothetical protein
MKKTILLSIAICTGIACLCQPTTLAGFEQQRIQYNKKGMLVLGSWSAANIITSAFAANTSNRQAHYFHQMNIMWNGVNLALAGLGYLGATKEKSDNINLTNVLGHQSKTEKLFLFNAGLDVAYVTTGFYLKERANSNTNPDKLKGYGNAVAAQGGFLLLFDAIMYAVHNKHGRALKNFTDKVQLAAGPAGLTMVYKL